MPSGLYIIIFSCQNVCGILLGCGWDFTFHPFLSTRRSLFFRYGGSKKKKELCGGSSVIWGNTKRIGPVMIFRCYLLQMLPNFSSKFAGTNWVQLQFSTLKLDFLFIGWLSPHPKCQNGFLSEVVLQPVDSFQYGAEESGFFRQMLFSQVEGVCWQSLHQAQWGGYRIEPVCKVEWR